MERADDRPLTRPGAVTGALFAAALARIAFILGRGHGLNIDEVEFFRATRWIALGRVPYRDFWEHHTPLQWFVFAPLAHFTNGPGTASIVTMRWAQVVLWIVIFALLVRLQSQSRVGVALLFLLSSDVFTRYAVEYRVDVLGAAAFIAAIACIARATSRRRWIAFGALMSAAALANMRLAPLIIATAIVVLFWRSDLSAWRFHPQTLWMAVGVAVVTAIALGCVVLTGAMPSVIESLYRYNVAPGVELTGIHTFWPSLTTEFTHFDVGGMIYWIGGLIGFGLAVREIRRPGILQILAITALLSVLVVSRLEVQYPYHFETTLLLLLPLAALAVNRLDPRWTTAILAAAAISLIIAIVQLLRGPMGAEMAYQDAVMRAANAHAEPGERVWDGVGWATQREPAYRYWFLPNGVRAMAVHHLIEPYDAPQLAAAPPAVIVPDLRVDRWFSAFPNTARYAVTHYVPLMRNVWIPGMSVLVDAKVTRVVWRCPRAGAYRVWTSELLVHHPWFTRPMDYLHTIGETAAGYEIPLDRLPAAPIDATRWRVDGVALPAGTQTMNLQRNSVVEMIPHTSQQIGVLLVPDGVTTLATGPAEDFVF